MARIGDAGLVTSLSNATGTVGQAFGPRLFLYSIQVNAVSAASSERVRAAAWTLDGTQSGNGTSLVTWRPELVWTSRT
jgi:hypothetical protein